MRAPRGSGGAAAVAATLGFALAGLGAGSATGDTTVPADAPAARALTPPPPEPSTAAQIAASISAQRSANRLPGAIAERASWSRACRQHNRYEHLNGDRLTHAEKKGRRGYSSAGAWAARSSVLAQVPTLWRVLDPFELAPLHLDLLLSPELSVIGADDSVFGTGSARVELTCVTAFPGYLRRAPRSLRVYTYPGDGARIYPSEVAFEVPMTPGQAVGIPRNARTGPYLYVFTFGRYRSVRLLRASLKGPAGPLATKHVDTTNRRIGAYLNPGGIVIPLQALTPGTRYDASVALRVDGRTYVHDWSFTADSGVARAEGATGAGTTHRA
jgi:hypothetical protein